MSCLFNIYNMSPRTYRMLMLFFLAGFVLNVSNYLFFSLSKGPISHSKVINEELTSSYKYHAPAVQEWVRVLSFNSDSTSTTIDTVSSSQDYKTTRNPFVSLCPDTPPGLGPVTSNIEDVESLLTRGGAFTPWQCQARQSAAIIVSHGGNKQLLTKFLHYIHPFLMQQQLEYQIFVVDSADNTRPLTRGQIFNIGVLEAQKYKGNGWSCIVLHDAHLLPMDTRNLYRCSWYPRQLVAAVHNPYDNTIPRKFGGAISLKPEQFMKVNGFSNLAFMNDADYADFYARLLAENYTIERSDDTCGTFQSGVALRKNTEIIPMYTLSPLPLYDGLSVISYTVSSITHRTLHTLIKVSLKKSYTMFDTLTIFIHKTLNESNTTLFNDEQTKAVYP